MVGFWKKWTFREPILMWTFYWTAAGFTIPFAMKALVERYSEPSVQHPPSVREMIESIKAQATQQQQQQDAA